MQSNLLLFGWNRSVPGRELASAEHFGEFVEYLGGLQADGVIESFEVVFLDPHGGDLGGFFLIRGKPDSLNALLGTRDWIVHMTRGGQHLDGQGLVRGVTGDAVMERMALWTELASSYS
jgi:hypothetical protein